MRIKQYFCPDDTEDLCLVNRTDLPIGMRVHSQYKRTVKCMVACLRVTDNT